MPWHVIVKHNKRQPGEPWPLVDRVFREEDYPEKDQMLAAVSKARKELKATYPAPEYQVASGRGPEAGNPQYPSFVVWLFRDE